ncbi:MAG: peroxide stress protein YaaA [Porticoccaceae bacterium]|nr:peroxide stress protein YaaA [Pseudomonadales bacterium]MCP5172893.1 peroxide stress protein YaaA [Pseudomonadales bacterium]MCP5302367.1 peroxide stress protein YaaA [Pseudomonadales bacterium]
MLLVISPAKTLDYETQPTTQAHSTPDFLADSEELILKLRALSPPQISELMGISDKLGDLNFGRYLNWQLPFTMANAKQAVLAFKGDVYTGLQADQLSEVELQWAQQHLRILSGLYGVLRPLDLMQPYRLEMGIRFANNRGKNLYEFWGEKITQALNAQLKQQHSETLINLASNEYFKSVKTGSLNAEVITPVFKDWKGDKYKVISFFAKKARGLMCQYIIKNRIETAEAIKKFDLGGYQYNEAMSSAREWVFCRDEKSAEEK